MPTENETPLATDPVTPKSDTTVLDDAKKEAEIAKLEAETKRIDYDRQKLEEDDKKKWVFKETFWKNIIAIVLGLGVLGFYINYAIVPAFQYENLRLRNENQETGFLLSKSKKQFSKDSITLSIQKDSLNRQKRVTDSLYLLLLKKDSSINVLLKQSQRLASQKSQAGIDNKNATADSVRSTIKYINGLDSVFKEALNKNDFAKAQLQQQKMLDEIASFSNPKKVKIHLISTDVLTQQPFKIMARKLNIRNDMGENIIFDIAGLEGTIELPSGRYIIKGYNDNYDSTPITIKVPESDVTTTIEIRIHPVIPQQ